MQIKLKVVVPWIGQLVLQWSLDVLVCVQQLRWMVQHALPAWVALIQHAKSASKLFSCTVLMRKLILIRSYIT